MEKSYAPYHKILLRFNGLIIFAMLIILFLMKPGWCYQKEQLKENTVYKNVSNAEKLKFVKFEKFDYRLNLGYKRVS